MRDPGRRAGRDSLGNQAVEEGGGQRGGETQDHEREEDADRQHLGR